MTTMSRKMTRWIAVAALAGLTLTAACSGSRSAASRSDDLPFKPGSPLISRVRALPQIGIDALRSRFQRDDLTNYTPTATELKIIEQCLAKLPPFQERVLRDKLAGICFVNYLPIGGYSEPVDFIFLPTVCSSVAVPESVIIASPQTLKCTISEWLVLQDLSIFALGDPWNDITFDCGSLPAFQYILLRESTRIHYPREFPEDWQDGGTPIKEYDFPARKEICFNDPRPGPKVSFDKWEEFYKPLAKTPFLSLYAANSIEDDLVEFVTFYHLTQKMGQPFKIAIGRNFPSDTKTFFEWEPMKSPLVQQRFPAMEAFYK